MANVLVIFFPPAESSLAYSHYTEGTSMLDETDRKILRAMQTDGRITNQALAETCHLSPAACFDRVKRLRANGYIVGAMALLDPAKLDRALLIFVEVHLDRTTGDVFDAFAKAVRDQPDNIERTQRPLCATRSSSFRTREGKRGRKVG
jgi:Lrp/AsnC family leucine-responsive transcriptional regulator